MNKLKLIVNPCVCKNSREILLKEWDRLIFICIILKLESSFFCYFFSIYLLPFKKQPELKRFNPSIENVLNFLQFDGV